MLQNTSSDPVFETYSKIYLKIVQSADNQMEDLANLIADFHLAFRKFSKAVDAYTRRLISVFRTRCMSVDIDPPAVVIKERGLCDDEQPEDNPSSDPSFNSKP